MFKTISALSPSLLYHCTPQHAIPILSLVAASSYAIIINDLTKGKLIMLLRMLRLFTDSIPSAFFCLGVCKHCLWQLQVSPPLDKCFHETEINLSRWLCLVTSAYSGNLGQRVAEKSIRLKLAHAIAVVERDSLVIHLPPICSFFTPLLKIFL